MKPKEYVVLAVVVVFAVAAGFVARDLVNRGIKASIEQSQPTGEKFTGVVIKEENQYRLKISSGSQNGQLLNLINSSPSLDLSIFEGKNVIVSGFAEDNSIMVLSVSEI